MHRRLSRFTAVGSMVVEVSFSFVSHKTVPGTKLTNIHSECIIIIKTIVI